MKLIGVAVLAGLMTMVIAAAAIRPHASPVPVVSVARAPDASMRAAALDRCRAINAPDMGCEAAWDAERRRFFEGAVR